MILALNCGIQTHDLCGAGAIGSLSTRVFETRTATGSEYFARQDSGLSQIFKLRVSNSEKILSDINVVV